MGFGAASLLPLAALAAIPVVIHILSRLRLKRAEFPSLLLLQTARRERFSWLKLKEVLLLIFRTLALLGLLLAVARPFVRHRLPGLGRTNDLVMVLDDSYSMALPLPWQRAQALARELLTSLGPERRALLLTASGQTPTAEAQWQNPRKLLPLVDSLQPSYAAPTLGPALKRAVELAKPAQAEVVVVTDLQARALPSDWRPPREVTTTLVSFALPDPGNLGVTRVYTEERFPVAGRATRIKADFTNYGPQAITRTALLVLDNRREELALSLKPRSTATVTFESALADSGYHIVEVSLRGDSLEPDNTRWLAVCLPGQLSVLVVETPTAPARYLLDALGPDSSSVFRLNTVARSELSRQDLRRFAAVVVTDAGALGRADRNRLSSYLRAGGTALLMLAGPAPDSSLPDLWERTPVLDGQVRTRGLSNPAGFLTIASVDTTHPALQVLSLDDLRQTRFFKHVLLEPEGSRVLARLSDREPLMLESPDGRLVTWTFTLTPEYTDLVFKAAFVPLLHRTLLHLASYELRSDYLVGDTIHAPVSGSGPVPVSTPGANTTLTPQPGLGRAQIDLTSTPTPGIYRVADRPYAVNVLPAEGDLTQARADALKDQGYRLWSAADNPLSTAQNLGSSDLSLAFLWLAALALAAELLLLAIG